MSIVVFNPLLTRFVFFLIVPNIRGTFGITKHFIEGFPHLKLKSLKPEFDLSFSHEIFREVDLLLVLRVHSVRYSTKLSLVCWGLESQCFQSVKAIPDELAHLGRVLAVGEDSKKGLIGQEVESREDLLFLLQIVI